MLFVVWNVYPQQIDYYYDYGGVTTNNPDPQSREEMYLYLNTLHTSGALW